MKHAFVKRCGKIDQGKKLHSNTWNNILIGLKETKLREVQWKIVHNIYPTNILLNKMGIKSSEKCDFCDEVDVVEHMFFRCKRLQTFWTDVSKRIDNRVNKKIKLNEISIVLGIEQEHPKLCYEEIKLLNTILIIGKLSIIKNKMNKTKIDIIFERELQLRNIKL